MLNLTPSPTADVGTLLQRWGFPQDAPPDIVKHAKDCAKFGHLRMGELVCALTLMSEPDREPAFLTKPANLLSLEHLIKVLPSLQEHSLRILAVSRGLVYLDSVPREWAAAGSGVPPTARARLDELNAAYVVTPGGVPLVLFSDFNNLLQFSQVGRMQQSQDPVRALIGAASFELALAPATVVARAARNEGDLGEERLVSATVLDNVWAPAMAKTDAERVLARLIDEAIFRRATDISIAPMRDGTSEVRIRIYGDITTPERSATLNPAHSREITNFLVSRSRAGDGGRLRHPADGQFTYKSSSSEVFIRASFIPADRAGLDVDMVSCSLRLLPRTSRNISLADLNLSPHVNAEVHKALMRTQGLIVIAGPTNSGKSTTIAGVVGEHVNMFGMSKKRLSLEDPVERYVDGITQISVDNNFAELIRAMLRHDPDLIWVGEIRDAFSAGACVRAATSGHVVLSTVHANNSILAFRAISNYLRRDTGEASGGGASLFDLAESVSLLVGQRLVKKLCPGCRQRGAPSAAKLKLAQEYLESEGQGALWPKAQAVFAKGVFHACPTGCPTCFGTGYAGELPINEVLPVTREVREMLALSDTHLDMRALATHRLNTFAESALELIAKGATEMNSIFV